MFQNDETAAMLVYQDNPVGVELFSYANAFFSSNEWKRSISRAEFNSEHVCQQFVEIWFSTLSRFG